MRLQVVFIGLALIAVGLGLLKIVREQLMRPVAPDGMLMVMDERSVAFTTQLTFDGNTTEHDFTLLTVTDPTINTTTAAIEPVENGLTMEAVMRLLSQHRPEAVIREIRVKREWGMTLYEVDFNDNYRVKIDALNGQMLSLEPISAGSSQPPPHRRVQGLTAKIALPEAVMLAQQQHPTAIFKDARLEIHKNVLVYKVKFEGGIDAFVDASVGQHLFSKLPRDQWHTGSLPVSPEVAIQTVLAAYPSAVVHKWKVKFEKEGVVYELKLSRNIKVYVSAFSGALIEAGGQPHPGWVPLG